MTVKHDGKVQGCIAWSGVGNLARIEIMTAEGCIDTLSENFEQCFRKDNIQQKTITTQGEIII